MPAAELHVRRTRSDHAPASEFVAAWLLAATATTGYGVRTKGPDAVVVTAPGPAGDLAAVLSGLLAERRFEGWQLDA